MTRPTDEITGKVVAKWMGWERGCVPIKPGLAREKIVSFMEGDGNLQGETLGAVGDPRTDPDAALELLGWLKKQGHDISYEPGGFRYRSGRWRCPFGSHEDDQAIPISGEAFRYAVVNLAADVLGVG